MQIPPNASLLAALSQLTGAPKGAPPVRSAPVEKPRDAAEEDPRRQAMIEAFRQEREKAKLSSPDEIEKARQQIQQAAAEKGLVQREAPGRTGREPAFVKLGQLVDIRV